MSKQIKLKQILFSSVFLLGSISVLTHDCEEVQGKYSTNEKSQKIEELELKPVRELEIKLSELTRTEKNTLNELKDKFNQLTNNLDRVQKDHKTNNVTTELLDYINKSTVRVKYQKFGGGNHTGSSTLSMFPVKNHFNNNSCMIDSTVYKVDGLFTQNIGGTAVDVDTLNNSTNIDYIEKEYSGVTQNEFILYSTISDPKIDKIGEFNPTKSNQIFRVWSAKGNSFNESGNQVKEIRNTIFERITLCRDNETLIKKAIQQKLKLN